MSDPLVIMSSERTAPDDDDARPLPGGRQAYWRALADAGHRRFEGPGGGVLTWDQVEEIADAVWGGDQRAS